MKKTYKVRPEFINRDVKLIDGSNTSELYELERNVSDAIVKVAAWREKHQPIGIKEEYWTNALPQVLLNILNSFDMHSSEVAAKSYLSKKEEIKVVNL